MEGRAAPTRFSGRAGHAFPAYRTFGSMRGFHRGKNEAAIAAACKRRGWDARKTRVAAAQMEEESL